LAHLGLASINSVIRQRWPALKVGLIIIPKLRNYLLTFIPAARNHSQVLLQLARVALNRLYVFQPVTGGVLQRYGSGTAWSRTPTIAVVNERLLPRKKRHKQVVHWTPSGMTTHDIRPFQLIFRYIGWNGRNEGFFTLIFCLR